MYFTASSHFNPAGRAFWGSEVLSSGSSVAENVGRRCDSVFTIPRAESAAPVFDVSDCAEAIVLQFKNPVRMIERRRFRFKGAGG